MSRFNYNAFSEKLRVKTEASRQKEWIEFKESIRKHIASRVRFAFKLTPVGSEFGFCYELRELQKFSWLSKFDILTACKEIFPDHFPSSEYNIYKCCYYDSAVNWLETIEVDYCRLCFKEYEYNRWTTITRIKKSKKLWDFYYDIKHDERDNVCPACASLFKQAWTSLKIKKPGSDYEGKQLRAELQEKYRDLLEIKVIRQNITDHDKEKQ